MIKKIKISEVIIYTVLPLIAILVLTGIHIPLNYYPKIFGDEYGYWAAGAWFAGLDWGNITSMNEYYGWGYGLLLSVLLRMPLSAKNCYACALLLNGVMLWGIYCIAYRIAGEFFPKEKKYFCCALGMLAAFMPSAFYYTQFSLSEVILCFFYWLLIYAGYHTLKNYNAKNVFFVAIINVCLISIHLRSVGVAAVSFGLILYCELVQKQRKKLFLVFVYAGIVLIGIIGVFYVKNKYLGSVAIDYIQSHDKNTVAGQANKLRSILSNEGISSLLLNLSGRLYTIFSNTYLLAGYTVIGSIILAFRKRKKEEKSVTEIFALFCSLNTLSLVAISSLYMICDENSRFDILIYSRYHEFTVGILMLLGIVLLKENSKLKAGKNGLIILCCLMVLLLTKVVMAVIDFDSPDPNLYITNPIAFFWKMHLVNPVYMFALAAFFSVIVFGVIILILKKNNRLLVIAAVALIGLNIFQSSFILQEGCLKWSVPYIENAEKIVDYFKSENQENSVYFMNDDNVLKVDLLQFMLKDYGIKVINYEMIDDIKKVPASIITTSDYENNYLFGEYDLVYEANRLKIWSIGNEQ